MHAPRAGGRGAGEGRGGESGEGGGWRRTRGGRGAGGGEGAEDAGCAGEPERCWAREARGGRRLERTLGGERGPGAGRTGASAPQGDAASTSPFAAAAPQGDAASTSPLVDAASPPPFPPAPTALRRPHASTPSHQARTVRQPYEHLVHFAPRVRGMKCALGGSRSMTPQIASRIASEPAPGRWVSEMVRKWRGTREGRRRRRS